MSEETIIAPAPGYIILMPNEIKTTSGIILDGQTDDTATVIRVGEPIVDHSTGNSRLAPCKIGDKVIKKARTGQPYGSDNKKLIIVGFDDIIATIIN